MINRFIIFPFLILIFCIVFFNFEIHGKLITDKGKLEKCEIKEKIKLSKESGIEELKAILRFAQENNLSVSIAGVQHSQGGHTFSKDGIVLDLSNWDEIEILDSKTIRVQAGARWKKVIEILNALGLSVMIMQSDYDFSVGGTISVNAHGWQANKAPIVQSIKGLHLMLANGDVIYCNWNTNRELFLSTIGGYGLMGIIIDVDLEVITNVNYNFRSITINSKDFIKIFNKEIENNQNAELFYGRFSLDSKHFLDKIILGMFEKEGPLISKEVLKSGKCLNKFVGYFFAKTQECDFLKRLRWEVESNRNYGLYFNARSRNQIFYHSAEMYLNREKDKTDVLQEYFIPIERFEEFTGYLKSLEKELKENLLNITIRHIKKDNFTLLRYASEDVLSFVMFFRIPLNIENDEKLKKLAQKLIDKAIELGGSYYLPYRPYPRMDQFRICYPKVSEFLKIKKHYDPMDRFQNCFYREYMQL